MGLVAIALILVVSLAKQECAHAQKGTGGRWARAPRTLPLTSFYDSPRPLHDAAPGTLIRSESIDAYEIPYEISAYRVLYHSRTANREDVAVSAILLIPGGKPPNDGWPVLAWAHDFRGLGRECAPSLMKNLGMGPLLAMYVNLGYAVVATDYSGLGSDSGTAVLDMQSNALDVIYAVWAARLAVKEVGAKWIAVGPFEGSMASVAAAESDVRDPNYLGSIAISGLADAQQAYEHYAQVSPDPMLLVLASGVQTLYPDFQVSDMFKDAALPAFRRVSQGCGGETKPEFTSEMLKPGWEDNRYVKAFFGRNTPGKKPAHGPLLVISGEKGIAIPTDISARSVARMCKQGDKILFLKFPALDASGVLGGSVGDQISWIKARFAGYAAPSNCH